ncbi:MAG: zinc ABC transporter substrate-binding protein, partial [Planctomycetia bacterium]|nr:zinc ABC transporter substrate-binding protein [Planctomycetia bacterium]
HHVSHENEAEGAPDPHVWLSPKLAKVELKNICDFLVDLDPDNAEFYRENYEKCAAECDRLDEEFRAVVESLQDKRIIVTHQAFGYLCREYGLEQIPLEGYSPYSEPTPAQMMSVADFIKKSHIHTIFITQGENDATAKTLANSTGVKIEVLDPIESISEGKDYFSLMRANCKALETLRVSVEND